MNYLYILDINSTGHIICKYFLPFSRLSFQFFFWIVNFLKNLKKFWPCHMACGILVPQSGIEPMPPAVEVWSPNHWTAREVTFCHFILLMVSLAV